MNAVAALQQSVVPQGSWRNSIYEDHLPAETKQHLVAMEDRLWIGRAEEDSAMISRRLIEGYTHLQENGDSFLPTPWPLPCPHFEHNTSDTPDVDLGIVPFLLAIDDLWRHPKHGSLHGSVGTNHVDVIRPF